MKSSSLAFLSLVAAALALCAGGRAADENASTIAFSDPSKPGTLKINLGRGQLRVEGSESAEVLIQSQGRAATGQARKDGLRVISAASGFSLKESDNVVTLDAASHDWGRSNSEFQIRTPRNTTVVVQNAWSGDITCAGIGGDIEINSMHGEIRLEDISGGAVVSTMNGAIHASIRELHEGRPLSFTTMNGEVVVRVPEQAKASVRLRTQNGSVLTDFDEAALVTKAESTAGKPHTRRSVVIKSGDGKVLTFEIEEAIREAIRVSATAVREALEAVKEGLEESRLDSDEARRRMEDARREMDRARREADRTRVEVERERNTVTTRIEREKAPSAPEAPRAPTTPRTARTAPVPPVPPTPPSLPVSTISGGKLVTGTLNGGGPEISVSTMNGDVTLRKRDGQ